MGRFFFTRTGADPHESSLRLLGQKEPVLDQILPVKLRDGTIDPGYSGLAHWKPLVPVVTWVTTELTTEIM